MKSRLLLPLLLVAASISLLGSACNTNPIKTAATATPDNRPETIAYASYGMFVIAEESAADIKEMAATPQAAKDALKAADAAASPAAENLRALSLEINALRKVATAGGPGAEALPAKIDALNKAITDAAPLFQRFNEAYAKAKGAHP